ncbi:hypothetical protein O181_092077 [Austropuccinia psidii MF-1]|uniref:Uncharacterized protein n=1 Tax=Austropuccinia psidii MF-1 TaxID=1389203 RepID=A0A9Q3IYS4_9BASI|nr:hypothetical protein [Austropuccinia psidii MF-1]
MSSRLTSISDSTASNPLPSVLYGPGIIDKLRELSEARMAPTEIYDIDKTYDGFKSVRAIEPPCVNCQKKGVHCVESATARSTRYQLCNLGKRNCSQASHRFPDNPRRLWSSIKKYGRSGLEAPVGEPPTSDTTSGHSNLTGSRMRGVQFWNHTKSSWASTGGPIHTQGNPIGVAPEAPILVTRKDGRVVKLKRSLLVPEDLDADAEGSDELDGEELAVTTPIQKRRIQPTPSPPVLACATNLEVQRSPQPLPPSNPSPTRPSPLSSTSTHGSTSRDPMSPEPESIFDHCHFWNISGSFTDKNKANKKIVTTLFEEVDSLTEAFVDKATKSALPGEATRALPREAATYEDAWL